MNDNENILAIGEKDYKWHICSNIIFCLFLFGIPCCIYSNISNLKTLYDILIIFLFIWMFIYLIILMIRRKNQYKNQQIYITNDCFVIKDQKDKLINFNNFACYKCKKFFNVTLFSILYTKDGQSIFLYAINIDGVIEKFLKIYPQYQNTGINKKQNFKETIICIFLFLIIFGLRYSKNIYLNQNTIKQINSVIFVK